jgi:hypothetical protein
MADPSAFDALRIPSSVLIALDWRPYHFAFQPYHYLIRATHVLTMAAFFGGIAALDLRLIGLWRQVPLRVFADQIIPWLYVTFGVTFVSGVALFLYDPVHVGSHAYFSFKLILTCIGLGNAALFRQSGYLMSLPSDPSAAVLLNMRARTVGALSLVLWTGVILCACLNVEGVPKVFLR